MSLHAQVEGLLLDIEAQLRAQQLWQADSPSAEALASVQPFCVDTLSFEQWLQFIFVPRMRLLISQQIALPGNCQIAPMAEEAFRGMAQDISVLIEQLAKLDQLLSGQ